MASLEALARGDERIIFTGYIGGEARLAVLNVSDVFALPATKYEKEKSEGQFDGGAGGDGIQFTRCLSPGCNMDDVAPFGAGFVVEPTVDGLRRGIAS